MHYYFYSDLIKVGYKNLVLVLVFVIFEEFVTNIFYFNYNNFLFSFFFYF